MLIAFQTELPETELAFNNLTPSSKRKVNALYGKDSKDLWTKIETPQQVAREDERRKTPHWRQEVHFNKESNGWSDELLEMMKISKQYWRLLGTNEILQT